jgi:maltooligosyltrehalose trehalohydrolase
MFSLSEISPHVDSIKHTVTFSIYLPSIKSPNFSVNVLYINKANQFNKNVKAFKEPLTPVTPSDPLWGDIDKGLWQSKTIDLPPGPGTYYYRFEIIGPSKNDGSQARSRYIGNPCARETSSGVFSVFHIDQPSFQITPSPGYKVPWINNAIIYEINVAEFNYTFAGIIDRLPYLQSLGINVIELMPITGVAEPSNWAYCPIFYFAPEERFGGPEGLKQLVQACHDAGIAIILDLVMPHSDYLFPYNNGYERFFDFWYDHEYYDQQSGTIKRSPNPIVSAYSRFGKKNDFRMKSTQEFFTAIMEFWISEYQIDGYRIDHQSGFLDHRPALEETADWNKYRPNFIPLQNMTKDLYQYSKNFSRFQDPQGSRLILIAEDIDQGSYQLSDSANNAINGCWEETLYRASTDMAIWDCLNGNYLNDLLMNDSKWNNIGTKKVSGDKIPVAPIIYHNCHDKSFLQYRIQHRHEWEEITKEEAFNDPSDIDLIHWWKTQPYAIALLTCVGTPMLLAGEEFAEAYGLPEDGPLRTRGARFLHWNNFYTPRTIPNIPPTETVLPLTTLYRNLCDLRHNNPALRGPQNNAVIESQDFTKKLAIYRRWLNNQVFVIVINFSDTDYTNTPIPFGHSGVWVDVLNRYYQPATPYAVNVGTSLWKNVSVPSNFGRIFSIKVP